MNDNADAWAVALNFSPKEASDFKRLAASMDTTPVDILRMMAQRLIRFDRELGVHGLRGPEGWLSGRTVTDFAVDFGLGGLPLDVRPTNFMWPTDKPFPWTAEECRAAVIGYEVRWRGDLGDFLNLLRGKWEFVDGYAVLHQS